MHIVASIQARLGSTRLPGKVLFQLGDRRILEWVIHRTDKCKTVDETVVAIGNQPENNAIEEFCERCNTNYIIESEDNLLSRHQTVAEMTDCDLLVRITGDCPFVPSEEIDRIVEEHEANDARYTTNHTEQMPVGTAVDAIDPDLLTDLESHGQTHPVKLPRTNPEKWGTTRDDNESWYPVSDAHIAVDTPGDYWTLSDAIETVGSDPLTVSEWVFKQ